MSILHEGQLQQSSGYYRVIQASLWRNPAFIVVRLQAAIERTEQRYSSSAFYFYQNKKLSDRDTNFVSCIVGLDEKKLWKEKDARDRLTILMERLLPIACEWAFLYPLPSKGLAWLATQAQFCTATETDRVQPAFVVARRQCFQFRNKHLFCYHNWDSVQRACIYTLWLCSQYLGYVTGTSP